MWRKSFGLCLVLICSLYRLRFVCLTADQWLSQLLCIVTSLINDVFTVFVRTSTVTVNQLESAVVVQLYRLLLYFYILTVIYSRAFQQSFVLKTQTNAYVDIASRHAELV